MNKSFAMVTQRWPILVVWTFHLLVSKVKVCWWHWRILHSLLEGIQKMFFSSKPVSKFNYTMVKCDHTLTHFSSMFHFCTPWKHQKISSENQRLSDVFRGYRNGTLSKNGLMMDNLSLFTSACTSASLEPSYVLRALGADDEMAHSSIR